MAVDKTTWKLQHCHDMLGSGKGEFNYARGMTISSRTGNITIADISNKRIQILNENFDHIYDWKIRINESLLCPLDVYRVDEFVLAAVIEGHATLWQCPDVTDYSTSEVKLLHSFGNEEIVFPRSIVTFRDNFVVSDVGKHRINLYDKNGKLLKTKGSLGFDDATNFNWPYYMCTDSYGRLAVSDSHNTCVKLFDKDLNFISSFGKDLFKCCAGVAYSNDQGGKFYVADYDKQSLFEFSSDGKLIQCIDESMKYPGQALEVHKEQLFCSMHHGFYVYSNKFC